MIPGMTSGMTSGPAHILRSAFLGLLGCMLPVIPAQAQPTTPSVDHPNRFAVTNAHVARRFFQLATTRRVDIAIIGDSNTRGQLISGHEDGMGRAFAARFGTYATRVDPVAGQGGWVGGVQGMSSYQISPFLSATSAPYWVSKFVLTDQFMPRAGAWLPTGAMLGFDMNAGMILRPDHTIGIEGPLRYHLTDVGLGPASAGFISLSAREPWPAPVANQFASAPSSWTSAGTLGAPRSRSFDIPPGPRGTGLAIVPVDPALDRYGAGPFAPIWHRLERTDRPTGTAYSPLWYGGGRSARDVCETFSNLASVDPAANQYLVELTRQQNASPVLLVHIMHGGNDANFDVPSLGSAGPFPSNTREGHLDNILCIIERVRAMWFEMRRPMENLYFALGPYHPRAIAPEYQLAFEAAWRDAAIGDEHVFVVAGSMLSTAQEFQARAYFAEPTDPAHLSIPGYRAWGQAAVDAMILAACPGDFSLDSRLDAGDVFAFLNAWFDGRVTADFDYSGTLDAADIFAFLNAWFAGCD